MASIITKSSPLDVADATKNRYIGITPAGTGMTAEVWYAIPRTALNGTKQHADLVSLRSKICAVKLYRLFSFRIYLENELPAMKRLLAVPDELRARFTEPLDFCDEAENTLRWYAMKSIHGFTLNQLRRTAFLSKKIVPQELIFHMYLQLQEALKFLHTSDPPMIKSDLVAVNLMIDPSTQDVPGFPNIKLIDFGGSQVGKVGVPLAKHTMDAEWYWLYRMMYDLAMLNHTCEYTKDSVFAIVVKRDHNCSHGIEFTDFINTLGYVLAVGNRLDESNLEQEMNLQERLPRVLKIRRDYASPEALRDIKQLLGETEESIANKFPTDEQILKALDENTLISSSRL